MRYLSKIVFINSAAIKYAEINLDGNIHLIGTQGVGKSTLLRAILYFYNADSLKLGIPSGKKSFAEHYFSYANSFIIYEVTRETGVYTILAFKSQGRVNFRFIDTAYSREHYIDGDGKAFDGWEKIRAKLGTILSSKKVDRYEEYRDILYGNTESKKEFKKFSLLESKQYQNIPRTIQNVFLSSKLEAEFIKQTIIKSLNEDDVIINLETYSHHLRDFENQLNDINKFRSPNIIKQVEGVSALYVDVKRLDADKKQLAGQLAWARERNKQTEPVLRNQLKHQESEQKVFIEKRALLDSEFGEIKQKIKNSISQLEKDLGTIEKKKTYYKNLDIGKIIERVSKKETLEAGQSALIKEKTVLTTQFSEITTKYETLLTEAKNAFNTFENIQQSNILKTKEQLQQNKTAILLSYEKLVSEIRAAKEVELNEAKEYVEQQKDQLKTWQLKDAENKHKRFFEKEIESLKKSKNDYETLILRFQNEKNLLNEQIKSFQQQWELEEARQQVNTENKKERLDAKIQLLTQDITSIQLNIDNSKGSLYGWLNEHVNGWEDTIGKVIDEKILFMEGLEPKLGQRNDTLFGVTIRLGEIDKKVKTLSDYIQEKEAKENERTEVIQHISQLQENSLLELSKIRKKFQPKIKEVKERLLEIDYEIDSKTKLAKEAEVGISDWIVKAQAEKERITVSILEEIKRAEESLAIAKKGEEKIRLSISSNIADANKERDTKIQEQERIQSTLQSKIEKDLKDKKKEFDTTVEEIHVQQTSELAGKGADTTKLDQINAALEKIKRELEYIDTEGRKHVNGYDKDKEELLDFEDAYRRKRENEQLLFIKEEKKYAVQKNEISSTIESFNSIIKQQSSEIESIEKDSVAFEEFIRTDCYLNIGQFLSNLQEEFNNSNTLVILIDQCKLVYYSRIDKLNILKEKINGFLGNFSHQNLFSFNVDIKMEHEFLQFATDLNDFISQDRISEFERRVNEKYAGIIKLVGNETTDLTSREGEINKIVKDINADFEKKNFVGIIQKIELKMDESLNPIVHILKQIKKFNDENVFSLGAANLFSSVDMESKNKKAIDLLKQLVKEIIRSKQESISLSDSFELRFRVIENQNDTGWVEKLANVGSEGTDILVKAMINIMLLNVFKEGASKRFKDFRLHCMMDEIGKLHPANVRGILKFANDRNIVLINGSPTENDAMAFRHIYKLEKDAQSITKVKRIVTQYTTI
ncbi:ATP-binding protein [Flavobacterium sp.]|uniref:ATP-binding protein n=1 Tax=Flavobacterium sp. TaxID=239 RepID=UPI0025BE0562|nr:ATP-binding protein [Flavobacterium sp.]